MRAGKKIAGPFFGLELTKYLVSRCMTERDLCSMMQRMGKAISRQYIYMLTHNKRPAPPPLIEKLGDAMALTVEERCILHRAAAIDAGYRIGSLH